MIRVGFDAKRAFTNQTGLGNYSRTLIADICRFFPEIDITLFTPESRLQSMEDFVRDKELQVERPRDWLNQMFRWLWRGYLVNPQIRRNQVDIYHGLSNEIPYGLHEEKFKIMVTIHDLIFERYPNWYPWIDRLVYRQKFRYACENSDHIIAISENTKKDIVDIYNIPENKISVLYQSCHEIFKEKYSISQQQEVCHRYHLKNDFILCVGTLEHRKNASIIIDALNESSCPLDLVLIGRDHLGYKKILIDKIQKYNLEHRVHMLSEVTFVDLPKLYQKARLFIYPSLYEGFGIPLVEAMYSEVPIIAANYSCSPEVAKEAALYFNGTDSVELASLIDKIYQSEDLKRELINQGKIRRQDFSSEIVTKQLIDIYRSII